MGRRPCNYSSKMLYFVSIRMYETCNFCNSERAAFVRNYLSTLSTFLLFLLRRYNVKIV